MPKRVTTEPVANKNKQRASKIDALMAEKGYITAQQAADALGVHFTTIHRWIVAKQIPVHLMNGRRYLLRKDCVAKVGLETAKLLGLVDQSGAISRAKW